ncbi:hypothetical protein Q1695_006069 [Nippostrongylus brasiliensis]|nr:hypothetical protein Q1695_006069 [Nippostrongylus brasiliensis]
MSFTTDIQTALDELDRCDVATILHAITPMLEALDNKLNIILERTAPKSSCVLCTVEENRDNQWTRRCTRYADPVARTAQASRLHLCLACLKPEHEDVCGVNCGVCGLGHNTLLCTGKNVVVFVFATATPASSPQPPPSRSAAIGTATRCSHAVFAGLVLIWALSALVAYFQALLAPPLLVDEISPVEKKRNMEATNGNYRIPQKMQCMIGSMFAENSVISLISLGLALLAPTVPIAVVRSEFVLSFVVVLRRLLHVRFLLFHDQPVKILIIIKWFI